MPTHCRNLSVNNLIKKKNVSWGRGFFGFRLYGWLGWADLIKNPLTAWQFPRAGRLAI